MPCTPTRYLPHALLFVGMHAPPFCKMPHELLLGFRNAEIKTNVLPKSKRKITECTVATHVDVRIFGHENIQGWPLQCFLP